MGWRTIDSAPRDGTVIDLWANGERWPDCYFGKRRYWSLDGNETTTLAWLMETPDWVWVTLNENLPRGTTPTHWMPHPKPPGSR